MSTDGWRPVFRAGRQGRKLTALWAVFALAAAAFAAMAVVAETESDRTTATVLAAVLALFVAGLEGFRWHYVAALDEAADGRVRVRVHRWGVARWTEFPAGALVAGPEDPGRWSGHGMSGAAPWTPLHRPGARLPFVLDAQGDTLDRAAIDRLTRPRPVRRRVRGDGR